MRPRSQETTERLSACVEALASALRASGADPDTVSRLLAHAGSAAVQALTLDLLHEPAEPVARPPVAVAPFAAASSRERRPERGVPLAA